MELSWTTRDKDADWLHKVTIVGWLICVPLAAWGIAQGEPFEPVVAIGFTTFGVIAGFLLRTVRVEIDQAGIRRTGMAGFHHRWEDITDAAIAPGMLARGQEYLMLKVRSRKGSPLLAMSKTFPGANAAAAVPPEHLAQVRHILMARALLRTPEGWPAN